MRMVLTGIVAAVVIPIALGYFLAMNPTLSWEAYSTASSTRVEDPGTNLVGPRWTGLNAEPAKERTSAMEGSKASS